MKSIRKIELKWTRVLIAREGEEVYDTSVFSPSEAAPVIRALLNNKVSEHFVVLLLDVKNRVLGFDPVSKGGISGCVVLPADVFRGAIIGGASNVILGHNHPSGDPAPSAEDIALTKRLVEAGKILGIRVIDHIIVGEQGFFAFSDKDMLGG